MWLEDEAPTPSMEGLVVVPAANPSRRCDFARRLAVFSGPGLLISVGYCDPGNWSTGLAAGAGWGYSLLFAVLASSLVGMYLQALAARLGIAGRRDLAQACRASLPRGASLALWISAEVAMVATDLAEVVGFAVGLSLLTGAPLAVGVALAAGDTLLLLAAPAGGRHARIVEAITLGLMLTISACFTFALAAARPPLADVAAGFLPSRVLLADGGATLVAVGILGATVMPHNLYLHSALVQQRRVAACEVGPNSSGGSEVEIVAMTSAAGAVAAAATRALHDDGTEAAKEPANEAGSEAQALAVSPSPPLEPPLQSPPLQPDSTNAAPVPPAATTPLEASFALAQALDDRSGSSGGSGSGSGSGSGDGSRSGSGGVVGGAGESDGGARAAAAPSLAAAFAAAAAVAAAAEEAATASLLPSAAPPVAAGAAAEASSVQHPREPVLQALRLSVVDAAVSLCGALSINASIVILAGTALRPLVSSGDVPLAEAASLQGAAALLKPAVGSAAAALFAVALLASGQSSTFTGTMAGQVVMEGFLALRLAPWKRRLLTRSVAVLPAAATVAFAGDAAVGRLLVLSQVVLAFQLPFAIVPLVAFASSRKLLGPYALGRAAAALGWAISAGIIAINVWLAARMLAGEG